MANLQLTVHEAQRQLAEMERQADLLLSTLSSTAIDGSAKPTPHTIVTDALNALKGYEAAITKLQPVLDSVAEIHRQQLSNNDGSGGKSPLISSAALDTLWKKAYPDNPEVYLHSQSSKQTIEPLPTQPATTLDALIVTFQKHFHHKKIKFEIFPSSLDKHTRVQVTYQGVFIAHILLEQPLESLEKNPSILDLVPIDINIISAVQPPLPGKAAAPTPPPPLFIQQLKAAAINAVLDLQNKKVQENASKFEMMILWLTLCAARITGSSQSTPRLKIDLSSGSYVPVFPKFAELAWKEAWEQATEEI